MSAISTRLLNIVKALPLEDGMRVLEVGCGPGAMARYISTQLGDGYILAIDRSAKAIQAAIVGSKREIASGRLSFRQCAIEKFDLNDNEPLFDMVIAVRVGALDGRHPEIEQAALTKIARVLKPDGRLFIDAGKSVREISLTRYR